MRLAFVVAGDAHGAAPRLAAAVARGLRRAGHEVETFALEPPAGPFPGHPGEEGDPRPLEEAIRANARFDAVAAFDGEASFGMFALDAPAYVHVLAEDPPRRRGRAPDAALVERALATPGVALVATTEERRATLARETGRDVPCLPAFVDGAAFRPAPPSGRSGFRALVDDALEGEGLDFASRLASRSRGVEVWQVARGRRARRERTGFRVVEPPPLDARPSLLRACDAWVAPDRDGGTDLPVLEAMACGLVVVAASGPERTGLLRSGYGALVVDRGDAEAAADALDRVAADPDLRARLREGALRAAAERNGPRGERLAVEAFLRAVAAARRPSPEEARALAETGERLRQRRRSAARDAARSARSSTRPLRARVASAVRRAVGGTPPRARPSGRAAVEPSAAPTEGPLGPGEPVVFAGQPAYFRSAYEDAVRAGWGVEYPVRLVGRDYMGGLPGLVERSGARTCVVFDPWLLAGFPTVVAALRAQGVFLVAYSTEPVPRTGGGRVHWDTLRRLDNLRRARDAGFDLWVHYDPSSEGFLREEGFAPLVVHPLPVSERLFHPEDVERDVDACFLGWSTPHREAFLAPVKAHVRTVHVAHGFFDEDARRLMNRSKVVLNLHCHEYPNFENRCVQALFCGRPLVSEELSGGYLVPEVDYLLARTPDEVVARVREVIEGGDRARHAPSFDRSRFLASSLRALLAAARRPGEGA